MDIKEKPIIFNAEMVRAILEGRKTQTRREMKKIKLREELPPELSDLTISPYGKIGDKLWVRETFWIAKMYPTTLPSGEPESSSGICRFSPVHYAADGNPPNVPNNHYPEGLGGGAFSAPAPYACWHKKSSLHMPREHSRILLEITDIRVERLNDISELDCAAEGISASFLRDYKKPQFQALWESIKGKGSWQANPFVWVISFKVINK